MKKQLLTVQVSGKSMKFFIMDDKGQVPGTPLFNTKKEATIAMMRMDHKYYTNIYNMPQKTYEREILGKEV